MRVVNEQRCTDRSQSPVGCVEKGVGGGIVLRAYPFAFQYAPQRLCNVEMRRVRGKVEEEKTPAFPYGSHLPDGMAAVDAGVVKHNDNVPFSGLEGQPVEEVCQLLGGYAAARCEALVTVVTGRHAEYVEAGYLLGWDVDVLPTELPAVRHVALGADMALICIEEVYPSFGGLLFKFLQLLGLVLVELRRGFSPWAFPYTLISCANADKKRLKVDSLASLPLACCHASRALFTLCLSCSIARRTVSSSEQFIIGLRPLPGRVSRPLMPSFLYLLNHLLTVCCSISVLSPTLAADRPSAFSSTARQRILKQCFSPWRYPRSSSCRCTSLSSNRVVDLISVQCVIHRANEIWFIIVLIGKLILNNYLIK